MKIGESDFDADSTEDIILWVTIIIDLIGMLFPLLIIYTFIKIKSFRK